MSVLASCGGGGGSASTIAGQQTSSGLVAGTPPAGQTAPATPTTPAPQPAPAVTASATKPASAVAPWLVATRIDALRFAARDGIATVHGDYWERSEDPTYVRYVAASQELGNPRVGATATYTGLDFGSGVEAMMLRVSLPSGSSAVEIRMDSANGPLAGPSCAIAATGSTAAYRTIRCALNPVVAQGRDRTLVFRFTGDNPGLRFNWFGFWARDTIQRIDELGTVQLTDRPNPATPSQPQAGTPTRTQAMLPPAGMAQARTFGRWFPTQVGDCPKWLHDTHWVQGDDGKAYPTWHPAVDYNPETGAYCTYAHDHGSDPRSSTVFSVSGMPTFGYVGEQHEPNNPALQRREDHVGYKMVLANNFRLYNPAQTAETKICSLMINVHVGTHSPDAFANTAHEMLTAGQCEGQEPFFTRQFNLFGAPGGFKEAEAEGCNLRVNTGITPSPANQPNGGVHRAIPTASCFLRGTADDQRRLVNNRLTEFWLTGFLGGSFYYTIANPSRYHDESLTERLGRIVDLCYVEGHPVAGTLRCQETVASSQGRIDFSDPRSSFRGTTHSNTHFSSIRFGNSTSTTVYTNAWGQNPSPTPDPARGITIRQLVPTTGFHWRVDGHASVVPALDHSGGGRNGIRSPN